MKEACAIFKTAAAVEVEDGGAMFSVVLERKRENENESVLIYDRYNVVASNK